MSREEFYVMLHNDESHHLLMPFKKVRTSAKYNRYIKWNEQRLAERAQRNPILKNGTIFHLLVFNTPRHTSAKSKQKRIQRRSVSVNKQNTQNKKKRIIDKKTFTSCKHNEEGGLQACSRRFSLDDLHIKFSVFYFRFCCDSSIFLGKQFNLKVSKVGKSFSRFSYYVVSMLDMCSDLKDFRTLETCIREN